MFTMPNIHACWQSITGESLCFLEFLVFNPAKGKREYVLVGWTPDGYVTDPFDI